jgi:hypothetical protein
LTEDRHTRSLSSSSGAVLPTSRLRIAWACHPSGPAVSASRSPRVIHWEASRGTPEASAGDSGADISVLHAKRSCRGPIEAARARTAARRERSARRAGSTFHVAEAFCVSPMRGTHLIPACRCPALGE